MTVDETLIELEEQFWRRGPDVYRERLGGEALMVFPAPFGIMERAATIESVARAPRWREVVFRDARVLELSPDSAALVYRGDARREDGTAYSAYVTSVYARRDGQWQLVVHQQTPIAGD